ncbi:MAG: hypothetical protein IH585_06640 [Anaerolineaceae bacterium]|nr:hypothetical protein [Anaerolineaceae bacterium]
MNNKILLIFTLIFLTLLSACMDARSLCSPGMITYRDRTDPFPELTETQPEPQQIEIKRKMMSFDQVVSGQLCNNHLEGLVYVGCDIEIYEWDDKSNFLNDCNFYVESNTIIYVAAHNNRAYYKGCDSCHMSEE